MDVYFWDIWFLRWRIVNLRGHHCGTVCMNEAFLRSPFVCSGALYCVVPVRAALDRSASFAGVTMPALLKAGSHSSSRLQSETARRPVTVESVEWLSEWARPLQREWLQQRIVTWRGEVWCVVCTLCVRQQGMYVVDMHVEIPFFELTLNVWLHVARIVAGNDVFPSVSLCRSWNLP